MGLFSKRVIPGAMSGTVTGFLLTYFSKICRALYKDYICKIDDQEQEFLNFDTFIFNFG